MVKVSDAFKELALAAGREISCEIEVGDRLFRDENILGFEFTDVIHSEDMQFGTSCSNRFHFEVITDEYIPLSSVVRPYVLFEGCAERCPLGVFFISRRYRRKNRYSITCYDMMYRLDDDFRTELSFPCKAQELLQDICKTKEIATELTLDEDMICLNQPLQASFREVLGYLAGVDGRCAKFDRYGKLCFRELQKSGMRILRDNYFSLSLTQDPCEIRQIVMNTPQEQLSAGEGTKLTTYICDNPFATQESVNALYEKWKDFSYHGVELDMQGLPFIESGDVIEVQNDCDNGVFYGIVGEYELIYDGALSATLYSRSKNPIDEFEAGATEENQLEVLRDDMRVTSYSYVNQKALTVNDGLVLVARLDLLSSAQTSASFFAQLLPLCSNDCRLELQYRLNDTKTEPIVTADIDGGKRLPLCLFNYFPVIAQGYSSISLYARAVCGSAYFPKNSVTAVASGQCFSGTVTRSPNRTITDSVPTYDVSRGIASAFAEAFSTTVQTAPKTTVGDAVAPFELLRKISTGVISVALDSELDTPQTTTDE